MAKDFKKMAKESAFNTLLRKEEAPETVAVLESRLNETLKTETEEGPKELLETITDRELRERLKARQTKDRGKRKEVSSTVGYKRATFIVSDEQLEKLRLLSLKEGLQQKEILEALLNVAFKHYEKKYGKIEIRETEEGENTNLRKFDNL